jgi:beta-glucuronidase
MFSRILLILVFTSSLISLNAKPNSLLTNVGGRQNTISLDGKWQIIVDPFERGSFDYHRNPLKSGFGSRYGNFSDLNTIYVPGDWNTQRNDLLYYEGVVWYHKQFEYKKKEESRFFIHFGAVNYQTEVYLNGQKLGDHIGGYTPFNYEVSSILKDGVNNLVLKVNNKRQAEAVPSLMFDWWNFGGITRPVTLIETPATFIRDYSIYLDKENNRNIKGWIKLDGKDLRSPVKFEIPELQIEKNIPVDQNGIGFFEIATAPEYWTPENPKMYMVNFIRKDERISEKIGFRTIETEGKKILLNGKPIFLKGVNLHAQLHGRSAYSKEDASCMLGWAKELGCNFVRLAHYPHSEETIRMAEEMGILVWSEIPVYWTIQWDNQETYMNAEAQLDAMIARDKNRANVIIWSLANETPEGKGRLEFLSRLANKAREVDDQQRLISAAFIPKEVETDRWTVTDEFAAVVDLISFNQYIGWFNGNPEKCDRTEWFFKLNKPVIMSEFGSSSPYGNHGEKTERYTEEFQEFYYERTIEMIKRIPDLSGTCPWNLTEHRSPRLVLPNIEDGFSRAGLISGKGQKKKAYYVMKRFYQELKN